MATSPILSGRSCGTCTLCCKLLGIEALGKPAGQWCGHCAVGRGCAIYEARPTECRTFHCGYLTWPAIEEHWAPARSKMMLSAENGGSRIAVHVDPGRPNAWREQPFYADLKKWAAAAVGLGQQIVVLVGRRVTVVLPDRDVDLGQVADDERIVTVQRRGPSGPVLDALKLKADDPRIAGRAPS